MKTKIFNCFFIGVIACSFLVLMQMFFTCRSLWLDESMLAWSVVQRSFFDLISGPLEKMQSAPVLYIYIVKIITLIFGSTELTLRIFSVICYLLTVILTYFVGKDLKYPLALCAFVAAMEPMLRYANEFKPYICDATAVMLVLLLYKLYKQGKISLSILTVIFCILIWFSNPACFFIAAVLIFEFFKKPKKIIVPGICCFISFALYFVVWLYPVIEKGDMTSWWSGQYFPLIPKGKEDIKLIYDMFRELSTPIGKLNLGISLFAMFALIKNIIKDKNPVIYVAFLGIFITLLVSYLELYPIEIRLWMFVYPVIAYLAFYFVDFEKTTTLILCIAMLLSTTGIQRYRIKESIYLSGEESNPIIEYVDEKDDFVYVYKDAVPTYCFKNNYTTKENVLLGDGYFYDYNPDLDIIKSHTSGYIIIAHPYADRADGLFADLKANNYELSVVMDVYDTKLYYYSKQS